MRYKSRVIITGNIVERYTYDKVILRGKDLQSARAGKKNAESKLKIKRDRLLKGDLKGRKVKLFIRCKSEQQKVESFFNALRENEGAEAAMKQNELVDTEKSMKDSLRRTRNTIRRTINSNTGKWSEKEKFLTLTFKEHLTDQGETNKLFTKFIKKLSYSIFKKESGLKYLCVVERMGNGRIHYHVLFFNLPYKPVDEIADIWGHGFVKINAIDNVDNLGAYVCKYMSKTAVENSEKSAKEKDKKMYFVSRGLHKPTEICDATKKDAEQIAILRWEMEDFKTYEAVFENEHQRVLYEQYNLNRRK